MNTHSYQQTALTECLDGYNLVQWGGNTHQQLWVDTDLRTWRKKVLFWYSFCLVLASLWDRKRKLKKHLKSFFALQYSSTVVSWLALSPHSRKVMGFSFLLHSKDMQLRWTSDCKIVHRCEYECERLFYMCQPCDTLATCKSITPNRCTLHLTQCILG